MKFKEIEIIKSPTFFSSSKYIAHYLDYFDEHTEMIEKISSFRPHKGDVIHLKDKNTHKDVFFVVKYCSINYIDNTLTIWCK